jgi:hypothetical protein
MAPDVEQIEALLEKNRALVARERERVNELKAQNEDTLQEISTSLTVPASAFGMSYARAYLGEKASIAGIAIDSFVGLLMHAVGACFDLSASKGGQRVGKFLHDIANGALASWTATLGAEYGAKKRLEAPVPLPAPQLQVGAAGSAQEMPKRAPEPMTFEDLAAITAARQETTPPANVGAFGLVQETPKPAPDPTTFEKFAAMTAAVLMTPRAPQQRPQTHAPVPQTAPNATNAVPPTAPPMARQPTPDARQTRSANSPKPYRFTKRGLFDFDSAEPATSQSCASPPLSELATSFQSLSEEFSIEKLDAVLRRARSPVS